MTEPTTTAWGEITDVPTLWTRADLKGVDKLTDAELTILWRWIEDKEIALPPAQWVRDEMADRGLLNDEGIEEDR